MRSNAELTEAAASGLRWITMARVATEILLLVSMVVLARLIPPSAFGMFAVALIVQELAVNVPSEGVGTSIVQRKDIGREHLQGGLAFSLLLGVVLAGIGLLAAQVVVEPLFGRETATLVALTAPWFLLGAVLALPMALLRRRLDFRRLSLLGLCQSAVRSCASVLLATTAGLDATALVFGGLIGLSATVVLALIFAPIPAPRWRGSAIRDLLRYGGPASLACFSWAGFRNGDYAIVGARLGAAQAGFYFRGYQLAVEYQGKVSAIMTQVAFPVLSRTAGSDELFALRTRMVRVLTVSVFPALVALALLAPVIVPWLFGPAWEPAVVPTQILAGAGAATVVTDAVGTVLMATGRARALLGYGVAQCAVYATAVLVASNYGLAAVSAAAASIHLVFAIVAYQVLLHGRPERTLRFLWNDIAAATVSCLFLLAAAWPLSLALDELGAHPLLHILAVGAVAAIVYLGALRFLFVDAWRDLGAVARRVLPSRPLQTALRRAPVPTGRSL